MKITRDAVWHTTKDYSIITLGLILYAVGFCGFILPHGVITGGLAGIAALIFFKTGIPVAYSFYTLNIILLSIAYRIVGRGFVLKTIYGASGLSLFMLIAQMFFKSHPVYLEHDILLSCISTGGTDIVAAMVSKYRQISVGRMILYVDLFVISSSYFIKYNIEPVVYGYVVLIFLSYMCDMVVNNNKQAVQFSVFSKKWSAIATAVNAEMHRGCTILEGTGWYTKQEVKMLLIFSRKSEALQVYRIIYSIDPNAFVSQGNVNTIYGEGFDKSKVKAKIRDLKDGGTGQPHQP